jgi:quinol monooxygenase YgiN
MIMTILEGTVESMNWNKLIEAFRAGSSKKPKQMVEAFLTQSKEYPNTWRGISVWHSKESLDEYRKSVVVPGGVLMFRAEGSEPTLTIFDIVENST